uniref:CCHC-type domain-containing protein n=1 Tax=Caenorhabditis japonica TaxID=281687 RepID=A0A8R1IRN6_CAEJA
MRPVMKVMRVLNADNANDLERSLIEVRNAKESAEELRDEYEMLKEEFYSSRSKWAKEKEQLKNTVRDLSKTAEKWRRRTKEAEMAAKRCQMFEEKDDESDAESEASEDYLSMRERLRRRSSRQDMSTDSARKPSGQEAIQEKKKCSGASKSQKSTAETVKKVVASMTKMMRVAALPEPKVFDGIGSFEEFKITFLMKFREVVEDDEGLVAILEEKFSRPIKVLFEKFEQKLKRRQGDSQTHALNVFEELSRGAGQKMWEYLVEVEKWSRKGKQNDNVANKGDKINECRERSPEPAQSGDNEEKEDSRGRAIQYSERYRTKARKRAEERDSLQRGRSDATGRTESCWNESERWRKSEKEEQLSNGEASQKSVVQRGVIKCYNCGAVRHIVKQCTSKLVANVVREGQLKGTRSLIVKM